MFLQQPFHQHPHLPRTPAFGFVIDGNDSADMQSELVSLTYNLVLRHIHSWNHPSLTAGYHTPAHHDGLALGKDLLQIWLIEENGLHASPLIFQTDFQDCEAPVSRSFSFALDDRAADRRHHPWNQITDRCHDRSVFIAPGSGP